ncbi:hypothetical protein TEA_007616 [Camellia sinensis var. sinensis]|uniref:Uncharacterized protein n=1 Tax=Camellia sinensis var. sinensis TaxID=542762 RepID=A0A4S4CYE6_CAMSN|nr:hypothetical protein TEA_007616 [Camellia sinensis var. sinensis]
MGVWVRDEVVGQVVQIVVAMGDWRSQIFIPEADDGWEGGYGGASQAISFRQEPKGCDAMSPEGQRLTSTGVQNCLGRPTNLLTISVRDHGRLVGLHLRSGLNARVGQSVLGPRSSVNGGVNRDSLGLSRSTNAESGVAHREWTAQAPKGGRDVAKATGLPRETFNQSNGFVLSWDEAKYAVIPDLGRCNASSVPLTMPLKQDVDVGGVKGGWETVVPDRWENCIDKVLGVEKFQVQSEGSVDMGSSSGSEEVVWEELGVLLMLQPLAMVNVGIGGNNWGMAFGDTVPTTEKFSEWVLSRISEVSCLLGVSFEGHEGFYFVFSNRGILAKWCSFDGGGVAGCPIPFQLGLSKVDLRKVVKSSLSGVDKSISAMYKKLQKNLTSEELLPSLWDKCKKEFLDKYDSFAQLVAKIYPTETIPSVAEMRDLLATM